MSLIPAIARKRGTQSSGNWPIPPATEAAPYAAIQECWFDTLDGSGATIHPSVVDMGREWNGYRWWCADTPYKDQNETIERPSIYASNDRINWHTPAGLTNPIHPSPSVVVDPELVWDPVHQRLISYYLTNQLEARFSYNGIHWSPSIQLGMDPGLSPSVIRAPNGKWYLTGYIRGSLWESTDPLGGWVQIGGRVIGNGHHGDMIWDGTQYLHIEDEVVGGVRSMFIKRSVGPDIQTGWGARTQLPANAYGPPYRPTLALSTKPGWVDIWYSVLDPTIPNHCKVAYTRIPLSAFP